ncbi:MAG: hypothetical protein KatS3mg109_0095 [Pirellulaceae bacterium]|nr:MAG: hypothetical protein KatS3mg109_0095 [Pirellulaceae bacterium]
MVPYDHACLHAEMFGGKPEDYLPVDEFLDQTKGHCPDFRHRSILHNAFGMLLAEQVLGPVVINSDGEPIAVREIARQHIMQDCGCVPTLKEVLDALTGGQAGKYNRPSRDTMDRLRRLRSKPAGQNDA